MDIFHPIFTDQPLLSNHVLTLLSTLSVISRADTAAGLVYTSAGILSGTPFGYLVGIYNPSRGAASGRKDRYSGSYSPHLRMSLSIE